jgi:hypothetical protein
LELTGTAAELQKNDNNTGWEGKTRVSWKRTTPMGHTGRSKRNRRKEEKE